MIVSKISIKEKSSYNLFISLLRIYLSFIVVNSHCYKPSKYIIKYKYILNILRNQIHVPTFFIISFFFNHKLLISKDIKKIKIRFQRILIPYILWPIIIFIINNFLYFTINLKIKTSFNSLIFQLLAGHTYMTVLWFQYNLIFITLLILIIELLLIKNKLLIFISLQIIAYYFQYSNINFIIFSKFSYNKRYTFGRFLEVIPFCITGYIFASLKILAFLNTIRLKTLYILSLILILIIKYNIFTLNSGFMFQGIELNIICFIIFLIFLLIPSDIIKNEKIINLIKLITNNTAGIYYLHLTIKIYTQNFFPLIKNKTLGGSLIIYIISHFISFSGTKIFGKTILKNLFQ